MAALGLFDNRGKQGDEDDTIVTEGIADLLDGMDLAPTMPMPVVGNREGDDASGDAPDEGRKKPPVNGKAHARRLRKVLEEIVLGNAAPGAEEVGSSSGSRPAGGAPAMPKDTVEVASADDEEPSAGTPLGNSESATASLSAMPDGQSREESPGEHVDGLLTASDGIPPMSEQDRILMAPFRLELDDGTQDPIESIASSLACIAESLRDMRDDIRALRNHICDDEGEAGGCGAEGSAASGADGPDDAEDLGDGQGEESLRDSPEEGTGDDRQLEDGSEGEPVEDDEDEPLGSDGDASSVAGPDGEAG